MNYIVFDLEWNQSPHGKTGETAKLPFEIVEIGAVKLNSNRKKIDEFHCYIAPTVYKELHYIAAGLLSVTMKELRAKGIPFYKAAREFLAWCALDGEYTFVTWGSMDLTELQRNCRYFGVRTNFPYPFLYIDLQKMFSYCYDDGKSRYSLEMASTQMGLEKELNFHSAMNDAVYTAQIMEKMDYEKVKAYTSVDIYKLPASRKEEFTLTYPTYSKFISMGYPNKDSILTDKHLMNALCPVCGANLLRKIDWFSGNQKTYYYLGSCREHGLIKGRMKLRKTEEEIYYMMKILKPTDEKGVTEIRNKQAACRERRREKRHREHRREQATAKNSTDPNTLARAKGTQAQ